MFIHLVRFLNEKINDKIISDIREKLSATESSVHMSSLVEPSGESAVLKHFDINPRWRKQLSSVERWCESRIFISVMNKALIQPEVKLESVEDLLNQVLGVAITEISKIVADIKSAQILLAVLDQLFEDSQITGCTQITEEFMKIDPSYQMIKPKLELYDKYLSIRRLGTGAETILKLVEKLGLKGSFEELVKVKTMVRYLIALAVFDLMFYFTELWDREDETLQYFWKDSNVWQIS